MLLHVIFYLDFDNKWSHHFLKKNIFILLILAIHTVSLVRVGFIFNATYIASNIVRTFFNMTCTQCQCATLMTSVVGGNCMTGNNTCYLINNYTSTDIGLTRIRNTTFFFRQIPSEPITTTSMYFKNNLDIKYVSYDRRKHPSYSSYTSIQ